MNLSTFSKKSIVIAIIVIRTIVKKNVLRYFLIMYMSIFFNKYLE